MRTSLLLLALFLSTTLRAANLPAGQGTAEGVACDAVMAYINRDAKAWLATLVRPIYGVEGNKTYEAFKKEMAEGPYKATDDKNYKPSRIVRCYKARQLNLSRSNSFAIAIPMFKGNMFVDVLVFTADQKFQLMRYHVLKFEGDEKWYFEPRPDMCPLFSNGLNEESKSTDILWEAAK